MFAIFLRVFLAIDFVLSKGVRREGIALSLDIITQFFAVQILKSDSILFVIGHYLCTDIFQKIHFITAQLCLDELLQFLCLFRVAYQ